MVVGPRFEEWMQMLTVEDKKTNHHIDLGPDWEGMESQ